MPIGDEVVLSQAGEHGEAPVLAVGDQRLGVVYVTLDGDVPRARFRSFDRSLSAPTAAVDVPGSTSVNDKSMVFAGGAFLIAWQFTFPGYVHGSAIHMASAEETSGVVSGGHATTFGFSFARQPSLVSLGDRAVLLFSGAGPDLSYEIWATTVTGALEVPNGALRLTFSEPLSLSPYGALGPDGTIGVVFDEEDETPPNSERPYFMAIGCGPLVP
jgi:hypothetical protein